MRNRLLVVAAVALVSLAASTTLFAWFERGNPAVRGIGDAAWWWVVTSATVGYGDVVPTTNAGRLVALFTIVTGFFVFANVVAITAESVHAWFERRHRGTARVDCKGHIVLCEYTAIADEIIQSLPACETLGRREVVIVTDLVQRNPYPQHRFVLGVPINPAVLQRANVAEADFVFVFANLRFADPDLKTLHVAQRVVALAPRATVLAEMLDPANDLLEHAPPGLVVMESRELMRAVLRDRRIDPMTWIRGKGDIPV